MRFIAISILLPILIFVVYMDVIYEPQLKTVSAELDLTAIIAAHEQEQEELRLAREKKAREPYVRKITAKYGVDEFLADEIVKVAKKKANKHITYKDIIAIIGIESSFRPNICSQLRPDPACGLMQIRGGIWRISAWELHDVERNIGHGTRILTHYYQILGRKDGAIQAYNIGITAYLGGQSNDVYLEKYQREVAFYR
ncbi:MAG: hypothetical protein E4H14_08400 [Candidatus Thorarchaeota archaeon]|nr:MAG: hypothetical protein E4H14_08400 [Candidatus Thorarchaeota archaeon]